MSDHDVLNKDVRPDNFIVNWSYHNEEYMVFRVVMIDFSQSRLRIEDESDLDWGVLSGSRMKNEPSAR